MNTPSSPQARVLVVDDEDLSRNLIATTLRRAGFSVGAASSGRAALDYIATEPVDLLILDMQMPYMSGAEVVRILRARTETVTLPIILITGWASGTGLAISGLESGADDFMPKPVRLTELVARVSAQLRRHAAWSNVVEDELRSRIGVIGSLGRMSTSANPESTAEAVVTEVAKWTETDSVAVLQVGGLGQLVALASFDRHSGMRQAHSVNPAVARRLLARAHAGPWIDDARDPDSDGPTGLVPSGAIVCSAGAPIYAGDDLVGFLTMGVAPGANALTRAKRAKLLAAAIDYASVLSMAAGSGFARRRDTAATRARLRRVLSGHEYHPVFQPIVELGSGAVVGYEALTRFDDSTPPDLRFEEADHAGLRGEYELATIRAALNQAERLPRETFLSINVSPGFVLGSDSRFQKLVSSCRRRLVLELTENLPIYDYREVRDALGKLGRVDIAVDDAGAGYASLRHIIELQPAYAKLDISLVRGIEHDPIRQGVVAGLQLFASRTGCRLIAEGVESRTEAVVLKDLGVDWGQGFLFGRPDLAAGLDPAPTSAPS